MARRALNSLKNEDYSDRELLHILHDVAGRGSAGTEDLARQIRIVPRQNGAGPMTNEQKLHYAKHCIATRFAWMKRFGWVTHPDDAPTEWQLTDIGFDLMNGKLTKTLEGSLGKLKEGDRILVMRSLTTAYRSAPPEAATMLRREFQHGAKVRV